MIDEELKLTLNGGDLVMRGNDLSLVSGVTNMCIMAMFGPQDWLGNYLLEDIEDGQLASETEALLQQVALNSGNRVLIEQAIARDLKFLETNIPGTKVQIATKIVSDNRLEIKINAGGEEISLLWNPKGPGDEPRPLDTVPLMLWASPLRMGTSTAYAIAPLTMLAPGRSADLDAEAFYDTTDEDALLDYLNGAFKAANEMRGSFGYDGNSISYFQGVGESWHLEAEVIVLPAMVTANLKVITADPDPQYYEYVFTGNGSWSVADWGDGTLDTYHPGSIVTQTAGHEYADGTEDRDLHIFHQGSGILIMRFDYAGSQYTMKRLDGSLPLSLLALTVINQEYTDPASLPLAGLPAMRDYLYFMNNGVSSFTPGLLATPLQLHHVRVSGNQLSSTEVDQLFNDFVTYSPGQTVPDGYGVFDVSGQTPAAPPTSASASARAALSAAGWVVITD